MSSLFEIEGSDLDRAYTNLREGKYASERDTRKMLESMWQTYEPYADADFRPGFARDPDGRFWEMYLGCTLAQAGKKLLPRSDRQTAGGQPDICVLEADRRIWIEAIAPGRGAEGPDRVRGPRPVNEGGGFEPVPVRQAQLRATSALSTKSKKVQGYLETGVIRPNDVRLIGISAGRFARLIPEGRFPLIISCVFPIGDEFLVIDRKHGGVVEMGFATSLAIERQGPRILRTAFLDEGFSHISGIIWSRIDIGNMSRSDRPLTFVHNPYASVAMPQRWGVWQREFVTTQVQDGWEAVDILAEA